MTQLVLKAPAPAHPFNWHWRRIEKHVGDFLVETGEQAAAGRADLAEAAQGKTVWAIYAP